MAGPQIEIFSLFMSSHIPSSLFFPQENSIHCIRHHPRDLTMTTLPRLLLPRKVTFIIDTRAEVQMCPTCPWGNMGLRVAMNVAPNIYRQ